jgi:hypothetical protein
VEPSDCENCIDFVYRLRCASEAICEALKRAIIEKFGLKEE